MARKNKGIPLDGVLLVNKPTGASSNRVLQQAKRMLGARKAGHTGALDPLATGLLPLCFGEATKFSQLLLESDKTYETTALLGIRTDSCDADGVVVEEKVVPKISSEQIESLISAHFTGVITQVAPIYSALKVNGRPMYELARAGIEVEAKSRQIEIFSMELLELRENEIDFKIHCSKGTYIRSIVDEIGQLLGCGAHVSRLHRIQHGPFNIDQSITIKEDSEAEMLSALLPVDSMVLHWPVIAIDDERASKFLHGNPNDVPNNNLKVSSDQPIRVYRQSDQLFIGIAQLDGQNRLIPKRVIRCEF